MKQLFTTCLLMLLTQFCVASTDGTTEDERRYLIKMVDQLQRIDALATQAQAQADPDARITLDYVALHHDLAEMQRALAQHIKLPSRSPRQIPPLETPAAP